MSFLAPFPGGVAIFLTLLDHQKTGNVPGAASHTFSMNCGSGGDVVCGVQIFSSGVVGTVTIGGVTAVQRASASTGAGGLNSAIVTATGVPSGVQNVVINVSGGSGVSTRFGAQLYSISGHSTLTPSSTATDITAPYSVTLNVPGGGAVLGTAESGTTSSSNTWTGITEDVDDSDGLSAMTYTSASTSNLSANPALVTTVTPNSGSSAAAWAVWGT